MPEKIETALVCYTQTTFDNLQADELDYEPEESTDFSRIPKLAERIAEALRVAGVDSDIVKVPQRSFEARDVAKAAFAWRLMDLKESNGRKIDLIICLDFPSWSLNHPQKLCWLDMLPNFVTRRRSGQPPNTSGNGQSIEFINNVNSLLQAERRGLAEAGRVMAGSRPIAEEIARSGLQSEFNPFPPLELPPVSPEWQTVIKRVLNWNGR
jgi:hypothetical protein